MDDYLTLLGTFLGIVAGAIITLVGEYQIERRHSKKELRDRIYGPMFRETNAILEALKTFGGSTHSYLSSPDGWSNDYLFFTIGQDLKEKWFEITERLEQYQTIRHSAEINLDDATNRYIGEVLGISMPGSNIGAEYEYLRLLLGKPMAKSLNLRSAVFLKLAPQNFIKEEKKKWGEEMQVDVGMTGFPRDLNTLKDFEEMYDSMLEEMEKDPLYRMEQEQRALLIRDLETFLGQIRPFIAK